MDLLMRAGLSVQGAYGALLERTHSEQGVSTAQYAFLVALIALAVALIVAFLGSGIKGLFGECAQLLERTYVNHMQDRTDSARDGRREVKGL